MSLVVNNKWRAERSQDVQGFFSIDPIDACIDSQTSPCIGSTNTLGIAWPTTISYHNSDMQWCIYQVWQLIPRIICEPVVSLTFFIALDIVESSAAG